jgi:hypothetical protein
MNSSHDASRRRFLKAAALGLGALAVPGVSFFGRLAGAAVRPDAPARRLFVLNFSGGMRSSATFFASPDKKYNPWGMLDGASLPFGKVLDGAAPAALGSTWGGVSAPGLQDLLRVTSIVGTWDDKRGDHQRAQLVELTGEESSTTPGILTRAYAGLASTAGAGADLPVPTFELAASTRMSAAPGTLARYTSIGMLSPRELPTKDETDPALLAAVGHDWAADDAMRARIDRDVAGARIGAGRALADALASHRRASRTTGARLAEPWVNVGAAEARSAAFGHVLLPSGTVDLTSGMLVDLFTAAVDPAAGPVFATLLKGAAVDFALAVRLLQLGAPGVGLTVAGFDLHSGEATDGPPLYRSSARFAATLAWLLGRIPDPVIPGRTLLDTTLVVTVTDFGRDPGSDATGFNAGEGSDHGVDASCFYVPNLVFGGGVRAGRVLGKVETSGVKAYRGDQAAEIFTIRDLLATAVWALGLDATGASEWSFADAKIASALWGTT